MRRTVLGLSFTVVLGVLVVALSGAVLSRPGPNSTPLVASVRGTAATPQGELPHAFLDLSTYPDSMAGEHGSDGGAHPGWVSYGPSTNLSAPAHSLVTVTVSQYDSGGTINSPFFATVQGTVGGSIDVNGQTMTTVPETDIGHTFTLHAAPTNQDPLFVNVPLPMVPDEQSQPADGSDYPAPQVVTFSFVTQGPGQYVFNCEYPCGDGYYAKFGGPMSTRGYMAGTFTVT